MLDKLIKNYLADLKAQGSPETTVRTYASHLKRFLEWCRNNNIDFAKITPKQVKLFRNYLMSLGLSPHTVNMHIYCLSSFYSFLAEEGITSGNPVITSRLSVKEERKAPAFLSDEEVSQILKCLEKKPRHVQIAFKTMLATGLRIGELVNLTPRDVVRQGSIVLVHIRKGKGNKERWAPVIDAQTAKELLQWRDERKNHLRLFDISPSTLRHHARSIGKEIGIHFHPHRLRHTLATQLLSQGYGLDVVQEVLGHENIITTRRYAVTLPQSFFRVAARVS